MELLHEFIFNKNKEAKKFINVLGDLFYEKGYLSCGDVYNEYYNINLDYNKYDVYKKHGWISIMSFGIDKIDNKYKVRFPEPIKIIQ